MNADAADRRTDQATPALRTSAASGVRWTATASLAQIALSTVQLAILGRLLSPRDFGLMAMVATVVGFAAVFADAGLSAAVIHKQNTPAKVLSSLYHANLAVGAGLGLLLWFAAPWIADFYGTDAIVPLVRVAGVVLIVTAFGQLPQALLQRDLRFRPAAAAEVAGAATGVAVTVATAALGQGALSFFWGQLAAAGVRAAGLLASVRHQWRPSMHFRRADLRGYIGFGAYQLGERSLNYWSANIDYLLVGRFLGSLPLGVYTIAYQLAVLPTLRLNPVLTRVAFPALARVQTDQERLTRGYLELVRTTALLALPLLAGFALCAPEAVRLLVGNKWESAVSVLQVLCVMGALKALGNTSGSLLLAKGRADVGFWWNLATAVTTAVVLYAVVRKGVLAIAVAQSVLAACFLPLLLLVLGRATQLPVRPFFATLTRPLFATAGMAAVTLSSLLVCRYFGTRDAVTLGVTVPAACASYVLAWSRLDRTYLTATWRLVLRLARQEA